MTLSPAQMLDKILVGNDAGYVLVFRELESDGRIKSGDPLLEIGRDDYYAEIRASLPDGLEGGNYTFTIEGVIDEHYKKIKRAGAVELYLLWRDTGGSVGGYFASVAGLTDTLNATAGQASPEALVAKLAVTRVTRRSGSRRYEATVEAREWVFDKLVKRRLCPEDLSDTLLQGTLLNGARSLAEAAGVTVTALPLTPATEVVNTLEQGQTFIDVLRHLGGRIEQETGKYGRGLYLIRDGALIMGNRSFPQEGPGQVKRLTTASGLIESEAQGKILTDPNFDVCEQVDERPPSRAQYRLTLKGRPDLKPGSIVEFTPPVEDAPEDTNAGFFGGLGEMAAELAGGNLLASLNDFDETRAVKLYLTSVEHRLGRTSGFVTTVSGVQVDPASPWDTHSPAHTTPEPSASGAAASPEGRLASAVHQQVQQAFAGRRFPEAGEVRRMNTSGSSEPPSQTLTVWRGLEQGMGESNQARRRPIQRPSPAPASGVAYLTPFAWGKCGLVLPRYPGTRVLVDHRNGRRDDPIDVGAFWESGHGPDSQPGDWWLILPVGVPSDQRASLGPDAAPSEHTAKVSQDLIDADGNRVIEVGELTVRIGRDNLKDAGQRPERASQADSVTIEHVDGGASIVIKSDGTISLKGKKIQIEATDNGDIEMKANNIKAQVTGAFDVT